MTAYDPAPLLVRNSSPDLYPVLCAYYQLESLLAEDTERMQAAAQLLQTWLGTRLKSTLVDELEMLSDYSADDFGYMVAMPERLSASRRGQSSSDPEFDNLKFQMHAPPPFTVSMHGVHHGASPYSVVFNCDVGVDFTAREYLSRPALRITVPTDWPLDDFKANVLKIASLLRLRWGNAGLSYSGQELGAFAACQKAIYAHSSRYPAFDVGLYAIWMEEWDRAIRTVNWLTFVSEEFGASLGLEPGESTGIVSRLGSVYVLQASEYPEVGDANRLEIPAGYRWADRLVRNLRAGEGLDFMSPWNRDTTAKWLRRFE